MSINDVGRPRLVKGFKISFSNDGHVNGTLMDTLMDVHSPLTCPLTCEGRN